MVALALTIYAIIILSAENRTTTTIGKGITIPPLHLTASQTDFEANLPTTFSLMDYSRNITSTINDHHVLCNDHNAMPYSGTQINMHCESSTETTSYISTPIFDGVYPGSSTGSQHPHTSRQLEILITKAQKLAEAKARDEVQSGSKGQLTSKTKKPKRKAKKTTTPQVSAKLVESPPKKRQRVNRDLTPKGLVPRSIPFIAPEGVLSDIAKVVARQTRRTSRKTRSGANSTPPPEEFPSAQRHLAAANVLAATKADMAARMAACPLQTMVPMEPLASNHNADATITNTSSTDVGISTTLNSEELQTATLEITQPSFEQLAPCVKESSHQDPEPIATQASDPAHQ
jgi:hypothetical protein